MFITKDNSFAKKKLYEDTFRKEVLDTLPLNLRSILRYVPQNLASEVEEIRLRIRRPLTLYIKNKEYRINNHGQLCKDGEVGYIITESDIKKTFELITDYSIYAYEDEIKNGFITVKGGHRIGICGRTVLYYNKVKTIKDISGLNIRISRQVKGVSDEIIKYLVSENTKFQNTLIVSPPQCGKTTLLRDIIRNLSNGMKDTKGFKVGIVDERSEIAGCFQGIPQNDIGLRSDVLDGCPKAEGIIMLIRSMSPEIIATDEIGRKEDIEAIEEALNAGIKLITTVHGKDLEEVSKRPILKQLLMKRIFERIIILTNKPKVGTIQDIVDASTKVSVINNNN